MKVTLTINLSKKQLRAIEWLCRDKGNPASKKRAADWIRGTISADLEAICADFDCDIEDKKRSVTK